MIMLFVIPFGLFLGVLSYVANIFPRRKITRSIVPLQSVLESLVLDSRFSYRRGLVASGHRPTTRLVWSRELPVTWPTCGRPRPFDCRIITDPAHGRLLSIDVLITFIV